MHVIVTVVVFYIYVQADIAADKTLFGRMLLIVFNSVVESFKS